jgi:hypothetical protein
MVALALLVFLAAVFWDINVFRLPGASLVGIEQSEIGEVATVFLLIVPAFFVDRIVARQRAQEQRLQVERLAVLRATTRTVQDIVGNALMNLYLFRADAEQAVSAESLALFDGIVTETAAKLKAIADLENVVETHMVIGTGIEYQGATLTAKP